MLEVRKTARGPEIIVSRTHRNLLRRLLEMEVPEIYNGVVEIKSIAREAGYRSKVAVDSTQQGVDPVGACVGMRGMRIQSIVKELHNFLATKFRIRKEMIMGYYHGALRNKKKTV